MRKIRVAIVGVGNCASSLVQGLYHYSRRTNMPQPGLITPVLGGYTPADIEIVGAFDITEDKVGLTVDEAIYEHPNCTMEFVSYEDLPEGDALVYRGPTLDGLGRYLKEYLTESPDEPVDVAAKLREMQADVVVNYLPVGSEEAARHYAEAALSAGCAFVNCMPAFIASDQFWAERFKMAGVPIVGDDIKSQFGATILHRALVQLMRERGIAIMHTSQLNVGGNTDFLNMLERDRLVSKKISKTRAVTSVMGPTPIHSDNVHVGPSDHVPWLGDRKWAHIRVEGEGYGGAPMSIEVKLEVWDSPNSAGVVTDAIRCAALAQDRGEGGPVYAASAYYMKSPPVQHDDDQALKQLKEWLA